MEALARHPEVAVLLERFETEPGHVLHVAALADQLALTGLMLAGQDPSDLRLLQVAALLHDIGWAVVPPDGKGHHKESARLIREFPWTSLKPIEVELVALTARYHRKALPSQEHGDYARLTPNDRQRVRRMAALLRVADALDRRHIQRVDRVSLFALTDGLQIRVHSTDEVGAELAAAEKKGDLLRLESPVPVHFIAG